MTLYRISNGKICIGLVSDDGSDWPNRTERWKKIVDAPPFAKWAIGKETYHVLRWFRQRGFKVQSKCVSEYQSRQQNPELKLTASVTYPERLPR